MKELEVDVFKLEVADKQDARGAFSKDWTARIIGIAVVGGFMVLHILSNATTTRTKQRSSY
jgi:hypothetical protein